MDAATALLLASLTGGNAPPAARADPTLYAVGDVTAGTAVTKAWPMLPGTPQAGTVYVLEAEFTATWGAQEMGFGWFTSGSWTQASPWVAGAAYGTSATLDGRLRLVVRVLSSSTARFSLTLVLTDFRNSLSPGTGTMAVALESYTKTVAAGDTLALGAGWGASAAQQGMTAYGSSFITIGVQG